MYVHTQALPPQPLLSPPTLWSALLAGSKGLRPSEEVAPKERDVGTELRQLHELVAGGERVVDTALC